MNFFRTYKVELIVVLLAFFLRLPDLGNDTFNTDVWKWKKRTYNFLNSVKTLDLAGTAQTYHPGVPLMVLGGTGVVTYNTYYELTKGTNPPDGVVTIFGIHRLQKIYVAVVIALLLGLSVHVLKQLFGLKFGLFVIVLLNTEPFFLAHTREFHLEGLVAMFSFASFLSLLLFLKKENNAKELNKLLLDKYLMLTAALTSLACLTKSTGLFALALNCFVLLMSVIFLKTKLVRFANQVISYLLLFFIFFLILWPAMWVKPVDTVNLYFNGAKDVGLEGDHEQLYFGKLVGDPGSLFYIIVLGMRLSPELQVFSILAIFLFLVALVKKRPDFEITVVILNMFLFVLFLTLPTKKLDRYIIPLFPFLVIASTIILFKFYGWLLSASYFKKYGQKYALLLVFAFFVYRFYVVVSNHPNYLFYYNPLVGMKRSINTVEPKWACCGRELNLYLQSNNITSGIALPEKYFTQLWPFISTKTVIADVRKDAEKVGYFVYPSWDDTSALENRFNLEYFGSMKYKGTSLYNVYKKSTK